MSDTPRRTNRFSVPLTVEELARLFAAAQAVGLPAAAFVRALLYQCEFRLPQKERTP